jgi:Trk K+ transport system NAD-binding subunit
MPSFGIRRLLRRALNRLRFEVGQFLLKGAFYRLLTITLLVAVVAFVGGVLIWRFDPRGMSLGESVWWAFLRLTDPGYLGDDEGAFKRTVSTTVTIIGYVLFLGALVAIMTQWLNQTLRQLESGLTPIARDGHVLVAGWTDRTVSVLREMFRSEDRSHTLLGGRGNRLTAVVLAEDASPELHQELRDRLGEQFRDQRIILRQGEAIYLDHLRRADFAHASAIVLPADPYLSDDQAPSDVRAMKTLMSIARHVQSELRDSPLPLVVAELFDERREEIAKRLYPGRIEVLVSDRLIGRMLALNLRNSGLAHVYRELLFDRSGQRMFLRETPRALVGRPLRELVRSQPRLAMIGLVRQGDLVMCPPPSYKLAAQDRMVCFGAEEPDDEPDVHDDEDERGSMVPFDRNRIASELRSLLVLGWTRKVPTVFSELCAAGPQLNVTVISMTEVGERERDAGDLPPPENLSLQHVVADYTLPQTLRAFAPERYDAVLLIGSDRLESGAESDARSIVGCEVLKTVLHERRAARRPRIVIELMDPDNARLFEDENIDVLVSPQLLGRVLAQIALIPELCAVYDDLFGAGGAELSVHYAREYGLGGDGAITFAELREAAARVGHVVLGAQCDSDPVMRMNPLPSAPFAPANSVRVVAAVRAE